MTDRIDSQRIVMPKQNKLAWKYGYDTNGNGKTDTVHKLSGPIWNRYYSKSYYDYNEDGLVDTYINYQTRQQYDWDSNGVFTKTQYNENWEVAWQVQDTNNDQIIG